MTTYKEIQGTAVQSLASNTGTIEGQIWYDNANNLFKLEAYVGESVSTSGSVNAYRTQAGGVGTTTAGLFYGGEGPALTGATEEFNGTSWTSVNASPATKSDMACAGTQTAALWGGGSPSSSGSFEYDGTSWTAGGNMTFAGRDFSGGGVGTLTAALCVGGFISPGSYSTVMQEYNGTSWTNIPQTFPDGPATGGFNCTGTQTAIISAGHPSNSTTSQSWDGSTWTTVNPLTIGGSGAVQQGTVADSTRIAGHTAPATYSTGIQKWDGTSWSTSPATLSTGRAQAVSGANGSAPMYIASGAPSSSATEIYQGAGVTTVTLTTT